MRRIMGDFFDFNDAGEQNSFDVIPDGTIVTVQLTIRPGGAGKDGMGDVLYAL